MIPVELLILALLFVLDAYFSAAEIAMSSLSRFKLGGQDYPRLGAKIAGLDLPTLFVMEGGYAVEALGVNTVNVLTGFEQG